jgi:signal transduction histidine kinase
MKAAHGSIRSRMVLAFAAVAFVPAAVLSIWGANVTHGALVRNAGESLLASARQTSLRFDAFVESNLDAVRTQAQIPALGAALERPLDRTAVDGARRVLLGIGRADPVNLQWCALADTRGRVLAETRSEAIDGPPDLDQLPVPGYLPETFGPLRSADGRAFELAFASPVRGERGEVLGALYVVYNASVLMQILSRAIGGAPSYTAAGLIDADGIRLGSAGMAGQSFTLAADVPDSTRARLVAQRRLRPNTVSRPLVGLPLGPLPRTGRVFEAKFEDDQWLAAVVPMETRPWSVVCRVPRAEALAPVGTFVRRALLFAALLALLAGLGAVLAARRMMDPIEQLSAAVVRFARGEHGARVRVQARDEIGALATTFNDMAEKQEALIGRLEERTRELEADIELRRQLEAQLIEARKLEAVGRLAGGIAHDFNNVLTVILANAEMATRAAPKGSDIHEELVSIRAAAARASELTRQLLSFARRQPVEARVVVVNDMVRGLDRILRRLIGSEIELVTLFGSDAGNIMIDQAQLEQVMLNLATNARDAMPRGGRIALATAGVRLETGDPSGLPAGDYVSIEVSDTGAGMTPETAARVFEPFFTTKDIGQGTGLGLASAFGVVQQANGRITVASQPGKGTCFRILLPRTSEPPAKAAVEAVLPADDLRGTETVLVAEDEPLVRDLIRRALWERGYRVLVARDGEEALAIARAHTGVIEALVTDVAMPLMAGPELARRIRDLCPGIRVLFVSGYRDDPRIAEGVGASAEFLGKPFTTEELATRVRRLFGPVTRPARVT